MSRASIEVLSDDDEAPLAAAAPAASATAVKSKAQPSKLPDEVEEQPDVKKTSDETEETTASPKKPSKPKKKIDPKPAAKPPAAKGKAKAKAKSAVKAKAKPKSGTRKKADDTTKDAKKDTTEKDAFDEEPRPSESMKRPAASNAAKKRPAKGSGAEYKAEKYKYHKKEMWGVRCNGTEYCTVRRSDSNFCYLLILKRRAIQVAAGILIFFFLQGQKEALRQRWTADGYRSLELRCNSSSCSKFKIQHHILVAVAFLEAHWLLLLLLGLQHWFSCRKLAALLAWMVNPNKRWKILQPEPQTHVVTNSLCCLVTSRFAE